MNLCYQTEILICLADAHTEARSRIFLHLLLASDHGCKTAFVQTVDSDIVVLTITFFEQLNLDELWVGIGSGKSYRDKPIHELWPVLGPEMSRALNFIHAFSGCDTTPFFLGCGKRLSGQLGIVCLKSLNRSHFFSIPQRSS